METILLLYKVGKKVQALGGSLNASLLTSEKKETGIFPNWATSANCTAH